ncbi:threonine aspartase 1 [Cylas formicarius]|uniref:threonine aspartase 1 n=1 Tax=Cylas formicarius TaxID=197179 RepID=UPI0029587D6D|nr:threonine aspartase 1 [Cylas formicarius]
MIAVHCGAGHYSPKLYSDYKKLCRRACKKGMQEMQNKGTAVDAVKAAVMVLENNPLTNAGCGSNLTLEGEVECDASLMDGDSLLYGACGAVKTVKNPIALAYEVYQKQREPQPLGLVAPTLVVGKGAQNYAKFRGIEFISNKKLVTMRALKQFRRYKHWVDAYKQEELDSVCIKNDETKALLDTVGAVCIDDTGQIAAACSSGGLVLKQPGRVGQAGVFGGGVWADSYDKNHETSLGVCTSGCGEHLVQTQLAKVIAEDLISSVCPTTDLYESLNQKFLNSRYLRNVHQKMCGALVLRRDIKSKEISLLWGHSTDSMALGYMTKDDSVGKGIISVLPTEAAEGLSINIGGTCYYPRD